MPIKVAINGFGRIGRNTFKAAFGRLDELELSRGRECGRPRIKYSTVNEFLQALRD